VDSFGRTSPEADVVIFDKFHVPAVLYSDSKGLFPIEGVYYYGEIKSRLTRGELEDAVRKFRVVRSMQPLPNAQGQTWIGPRFLFAWSSDLKDGGIEEEFARYAELDEVAKTDPAATIICIVGKGYCYCHQDVGEVTWFKVGAADGIQEVVNFVGGVANSLMEFRLNRFGTKFGNYIIPVGKPARLS